MPKIIWRGIIKNEEDFPSSHIPEDAKKLKGEVDMKNIQIKALPFMLPPLVLCILCMILKTSKSGVRIMSPPFLFLGTLIGLLLLLLHELLHAVAYPKGATVYIGIMPGSFAAVALSASPIRKSTFIFSSLLPIILGIIPLALFYVSSPEALRLNGLLFGMAVMGMVSVYPDLYNIFIVLRHVPRGATLQNNKNETYFY